MLSLILSLPPSVMTYLGLHPWASRQRVGKLCRWFRSSVDKHYFNQLQRSSVGGSEPPPSEPKGGQALSAELREILGLLPCRGRARACVGQAYILGRAKHGLKDTGLREREGIEGGRASCSSVMMSFTG